MRDNVKGSRVQLLRTQRTTLKLFVKKNKENLDYGIVGIPEEPEPLYDVTVF